MIAYHFLREDMAAGEGEELAWEIGKERTVTGKIALCQRGYHSSPSWRAALRYAPGPVACIVDVSEPVAKDEDKQVSSRRRLLAAANVKTALLVWAADCAERALSRERAAGRATDQRSWDAIVVLQRYVAGEASETDVRAAANAAYVAANAAYVAANAAYVAANAANAANAAAAYAAEVEWQERRMNELLDGVVRLP